MMTAFPNPAHVLPDDDAQAATLLDVFLRHAIPAMLVSVVASLGIAFMACMAIDGRGIGSRWWLL